MDKTLALSLIGGTHKQVADAIGVSRSAISQWPDPLPQSLEDRVLAAWARQHVKNLPAEFRRKAATHCGAPAKAAMQPQETGNA